MKATVALRRRLRGWERSFQRKFLQRGRRTVIWTQPNGNLGNFLYEWMSAFVRQQGGHDVVCLHTTAMDPWMRLFGSAAEKLVVPQDEVRWFDRRDPEVHNEFGRHFTASDLATFCERFVEPSGVIWADRVPDAWRLGEGDVVVNVRRGDYYSDDVHRRNYSFDVNEYLAAALPVSIAVGGRIDRIFVVSDGIDWCKQHLDWLRGHCSEVVFEDQGLSPAVHLALLANAPRLILTNSTFSYWGGYLSAWKSGRPANVVAPWFHVRTEFGGAAWQLDPRWSIVRDLPSGWAPVD